MAAECTQSASCPLAGSEAINIIKRLERIQNSQDRIVIQFDGSPDGLDARVRSLETTRDKKIGWDMSKIASRGLLLAVMGLIVTVLGMLGVGGMNMCL